MRAPPDPSFGNGGAFLLGEKSAGMRPKTPPTGIAGHVVPTEEERANLKLRDQRTRDGLKSKKGRVGSRPVSKLFRTCSAQWHPASSGPGATPVTAGNRWAKRGGLALAQPCKYVLPAQALSGNGLPQPAAPPGGPPSESPPYVYTRDELSDMGPISQRAEVVSPSEIAPYAYTRGTLSGSREAARVFPA